MFIWSNGRAAIRLFVFLFAVRYRRISVCCSACCAILTLAAAANSIAGRHLSNTSGFGLENSLGKEDAIAALRRLRPEIVDGTAVGDYFDNRGRVIDELFGGRVSFQVRQG